MKKDIGMNIGDKFYYNVQKRIRIYTWHKIGNKIYNNKLEPIRENLGNILMTNISGVIASNIWNNKNKTL